MSQDNQDTGKRNRYPSINGKYLTDFQRNFLKESLKKEHRKAYRQRIEIMLLADEGFAQTTICKTLQCAPDTARYWMTMARIGLAHLWGERLIGRPRKVNEAYLARLTELIANGPKNYGYSFNRWTGQSLSKHLAQEFAIEISPRHLNRLLKSLNLSLKDNHVTPPPSICTPGGIVIRDLEIN
ncbi:MAG: helix-turn-helix domain-containing protein [Gloeocapsa sp. DLM2.Bin57]|nr:MAG: helix-turn-helix domain-containing protein [Gloeocapsa sp. DLM2.Bin57]